MQILSRNESRWILRQYNTTERKNISGMNTRELLGTFDRFEYYVKFTRHGSKYLSFQLEKSTATEQRSFTKSDSKLIILDSIKSGAGRTEDNDFHSIVIKPILDVLNWNYSYIKTTSREFVRRFAQSLDLSENYEIWIISGDTTISEFFNHLPTEDLTVKPFLKILPLPMGTGNAWANSLGFDSPITSIRSYFNGGLKARDTPLYGVTFPNGFSTIFFIIFSLGFHANLLHACEDPKYAKMGEERFKIAAQGILENYDLDLNITVDGITRSYAYFALINTPNLEATYKPSPRSSSLEKELRLLGYFSSLTHSELVEKIMQGYQNKRNDDLPSDEGSIYKSFTDGFKLVLNYPLEDSASHKFEVCCDGILLNLLDYQSSDSNKPSNEIQFQFLNDYSSFYLQVFAP